MPDRHDIYGVETGKAWKGMAQHTVIDSTV